MDNVNTNRNALDKIARKMRSFLIAISRPSLLILLAGFLLYQIGYQRERVTSTKIVHRINQDTLNHLKQVNLDAYAELSGKAGKAKDNKFTSTEDLEKYLNKRDVSVDYHQDIKEATYSLSGTDRLLIALLADGGSLSLVSAFVKIILAVLLMLGLVSVAASLFKLLPAEENTQKIVEWVHGLLPEDKDKPAPKSGLVSSATGTLISVLGAGVLVVSAGNIAWRAAAGKSFSGIPGTTPVTTQTVTPTPTPPPTSPPSSSSSPGSSPSPPPSPNPAISPEPAKTPPNNPMAALELKIGEIEKELFVLKSRPVSDSSPSLYAIASNLRSLRTGVDGSLKSAIASLNAPKDSLAQKVGEVADLKNGINSLKVSLDALNTKLSTKQGIAVDLDGLKTNLGGLNDTLSRIAGSNVANDKPLLAELQSVQGKVNEVQIKLADVADTERATLQRQKDLASRHLGKKLWQFIRGQK